MSAGVRAAVAAPSTVKGSRISRGFLAVAVAFTVLMILIVLGLVAFARAGQPYLALANPVGYGVAIQESDLVQVRLSSADGLAPIPAADMDQVVGKYPTMPLAAGTLLTAAQIAGQAVPDGSQVVSITVKADKAPATPLTAGAPVLLVHTDTTTTTAAATVSGTEPVMSRPVPGVVRGVRALDYGAGNVVDVLVDDAEGPAVARAAASGDIALLVTAGT